MSEPKPFCPSHPNPLCPMKEGKERCDLCGYDFSGQKLDRESRNAFWEQARLEGEKKQAEEVTVQQAADEADETDWLKARSTDIEAGYANHLGRQSLGKHRGESEKRIAELSTQRREAKAQQLRDEQAERKKQQVQLAKEKVAHEAEERRRLSVWPC